MNHRRQKTGAKPTLSGRLGEAIVRRRNGGIMPRSTTETYFGSEVVSFPKDASPVSEILDKAKVNGRAARQTEYLHVSDLLGKCIRRIAIVESLKLPQRSQGLSMTDSLTFAQGDAIHDVIKHRISIGGPKHLWGRWKCRCGSTVTEHPSVLSEVDLTVTCSACKQPTVSYVEVSMRDDEFKVVGNPDVVLFMSEFKALYVAELKSISHDLWKDLVRPQPEHVMQVVFYWLLMRRKGYRLLDKVSVVYATKGWMFSGSPIKEFVLDPFVELPRLNTYIDDAKAMVAFRKGGDLPKRPCQSAQVTQAKACDVCSTCFGAPGNEKPVEISISAALSGSASRRRVV